MSIIPTARQYEILSKTIQPYLNLRLYGDTPFPLLRTPMFPLSITILSVDGENVHPIRCNQISHRIGDGSIRSYQGVNPFTPHYTYEGEVRVAEPHLAFLGETSFKGVAALDEHGTEADVSGTVVCVGPTSFSYGSSMRSIFEGKATVVSWKIEITDEALSTEIHKTRKEAHKALAREKTLRALAKEQGLEVTGEVPAIKNIEVARTETKTVRTIIQPR